MDSCGLFLDYSKNLVNEQTIALLMRLAREAGLQPSIEALLDGKPVNASEGARRCTPPCAARLGSRCWSTART